LPWVGSSLQVKEQRHSGLLRSSTDSFVEDACKKILATTDKSLMLIKGQMINGSYLPQIPESFLPIFVKAYDEGKALTEVELEYYVTHETGGDKLLCPKTTSNNEVIISVVEDKVYTRSEVKKLLDDIYYNRANINLTYDIWVEENLK